MFVYDPHRECSKCSIKDTAFFMQESEGYYYISDICFLCKRKGQLLYYYEKPKHLRWKRGFING